VSQRGPVVDLIEDSRHLITDVREALRSLGLRVRSHSTVQQFLAQYDPTDPGCLVCNIRLPGTSGRKVLEHLNFIDAGTPVVLVGDSVDMAVAVDALQLGAFDFLELPLDHARLADCVRRAIEFDNAKREQDEMVERIYELTRLQPTASRRLH
jgi:two-component system response regulator TtrR